VPLHEERFHQLYLQTTKYSVRGQQNTIMICKLRDWAVDEVIGPQ